MSSKRKSMDDILASSFVFDRVPNESGKDRDLIDLLNQPEEYKEATVRITIDLPRSMHRKFTIFCATNGKTKSQIVRILLEFVLSKI